MQIIIVLVAGVIAGIIAAAFHLSGFQIAVIVLLVINLFDRPNFTAIAEFIENEFQDVKNSLSQLQDVIDETLDTVKPKIGNDWEDA